jgi:hypothetical protein
MKISNKNFRPSFEKMTQGVDSAGNESLLNSSLQKCNILWLYLHPFKQIFLPVNVIIFMSKNSGMKNLQIYKLKKWHLPRSLIEVFGSFWTLRWSLKRKGQTMNKHFQFFLFWKYFLPNELEDICRFWLKLYLCI